MKAIKMKSIGTWLVTLLAATLTLGALPAYADIPATERQVLVDLYSRTNGTDWTHNTNWLTGDPCTNSWYGITCDVAKEHVTRVGLGANNLDGRLPANLNGLTALQQFLVSNNNLSGPIPDLAGLTALRAFDVRDNELNGSIPALTGLTALQQFLVSNNILSGPIPDLTGLTELWHFSVSSNNLSGPIPDLAGVPALEIFYASSNNLSGPIPDLAGLTKLEYFSAFNNDLSGPIPALAGLTALESFSVGNNDLSGPIPDLAGLTALKFFNASSNNLSGPIPDLAGLTALEEFRVENNNLSGPIPALAGLTALEEFRVENNKLIGPPPAAPGSLVTSNPRSRLCFNYLEPSADAGINSAWNTATGEMPWHQSCANPANAPATWTVTSMAGSGGSVWPADAQTDVADGVATSLGITPDAGYEIDSVGGTCGGALTGTVYETNPVTGDCTVEVSFKPAAAPAAVTPIPTLGQWALLLLAGLLGLMGVHRLQTRRF